MRRLGVGRSLAFVGALLALGVAPTGAFAAPTWLAPQDISDLNQSITFPEVAVNAAGDAVAIWPRDTGSETIVEAVERPAGGDWSEPVPLSDLSEEDEPSDVHIGLDTAGNALAVWSASGEVGQHVIRTAARPAGGDWSDPEDLFADGGRTPHLAMNAAGDAVAVWAGFDGVDDEVTWAAVRPAGGDWSAPEELSVVDENDGFHPEVAIDAAGNAIAVWQRFDLSDDAVQAAVRPAGGEWSAPDIVSGAGDDARSPRIAVNASGTAVAAWTLLGGGIQAAVRPAGGEWWAPQDVSAVGAEPALAVNSNGSAFALWPGPGSAERVLRVATRPPGGDWSEPEELSPEAEKFQSYDLEANAAAGVVATWTRGVSATSHEVQAAVRPPGSEWSAPEDLSAEGEDAGLPDLAFDAEGNAVAIWGRDAGAGYLLQGAGYDFTGPRLDDLQIPAAGTVGEPVSVAVSPFDVFSLGATSWTFGDGSPAASGNTASHVYTAPGTYPVTVDAFDASGNASTQTETIAIAARPAPPPPPPPPPQPPGPGPQIALFLRVDGKSLRKLLRTGRLGITATVSDAARVVLSGRARLRIRIRGKARTRLIRVFRRKRIRFAAAGSRRVRLMLTRRGRKALRRSSRARILITGRSSDRAGDVAMAKLARTLPGPRRGGIAPR